MRLDSNQILSHNDSFYTKHRESLQFLHRELNDKGIDVEAVMAQIQQFQVAIPSWALGAGGPDLVDFL